MKNNIRICTKDCLYFKINKGQILDWEDIVTLCVDIIVDNNLNSAEESRAFDECFRNFREVTFVDLWEKKRGE